MAGQMPCRVPHSNTALSIAQDYLLQETLKSVQQAFNELAMMLEHRACTQALPSAWLTWSLSRQGAPPVELQAQQNRTDYNVPAQALWQMEPK